MDVLKGGWHPKGSSSTSSSSSTSGGYRGKLSELKGKATGKPVDKHDYDAARNHQSAPLSSLRDPATFAPPPKHSAYYGAGAQNQAVARTGTTASNPVAAPRGPSPGLGGPLVETGYAQRRAAEQRERQEQAELNAAKPKGPYRADTSGLRTDNLPPPPVKRVATIAEGGSGAPAAPVRRASPALPPRVPPRQAGPPPSLPPRQNEYPDEHTPAPPPAYQEAISQPAVQSSPAPAVAAQRPGTINQFAANRPGQAGVSVAGFGIGGGNNATSSNSSATPAQPTRNYGQQIGQIGALHQRYSNSTASDPAAGSGQTVKSYGQQIGQASELHKRLGNSNISDPAANPSKGYDQQIGQIGELQQRFSKMNTQNSNAPSTPSLAPNALSAVAAAAQKKPPPPPPKRADLAAPPQPGGASSSMAPPPLPLSSKPKPF
jgi:hypothetical protein